VREIVAVDNGSTDGSFEWLARQSDVHPLENSVNVGFAAANNQGIQASTSEIVLLINSDVVMSQDYVERCVAHFETAGVGSVTGKLLRPDPSHLLDSAGHTVYGLGWAENRGEELPDAGFDRTEEVFGVCAACALYRREALEDVASDGEYFDESFFAYIEDIDLDWRLRWKGWQAWYEPRARAVHHRSASGARFTAPVMRHILKNRLLTVLKDYDRGMLLRHAPAIVLFTATKTVDFARRRPSAVLGLFDAVRLLPSALRKRRTIMSGRRAGGADVSAWLQPFPWSGRARRRLLRARPHPPPA
jgi:GT2 family glycosyltransferase